MKNLMLNWKTTSTGLTMIIGSTVHLIFAIRSGTADENTWTVSLLAIMGGIGLLFAGDGNKSATVMDIQNVQAQLSKVPDAINSGDTTFLTKSIEQPNKTTP